MSLIGEYETDNIFAKILRGEMPCVKLYEDADVLSFMDVFPQSKGHALVIPKAASRNMLDTDPQTLSAVISRTQIIAKAVKSALKPDGIQIMQFNGASAGQTVFHLHFHIIPRYDGEAMAFHAHGNMADMNVLNAVAEHIKAAL